MSRTSLSLAGFQLIIIGRFWVTAEAKRVRRLLRQMGLEAIYPKPRLSEPAPGHRIYPYRLRNVVITRPN